MSVMVLSSSFGQTKDNFTLRRIRLKKILSCVSRETQRLNVCTCVHCVMTRWRAFRLLRVNLSHVVHELQTTTQASKSRRFKSV